MNNFSLKGTIHKIFPTEQKSEKFAARNFVLDFQEGKYPQLILFQLTQAKVLILDTFEEGQEVTVNFNINGREWNDKYFTNLTAYRIDQTEVTRSTETPPNNIEFGDLNDTAIIPDDLPF